MKNLKIGSFLLGTNYIPDDPSCDLETEPINQIVESNGLSVFEHKGFWQCMDTYRDYIGLNKLWKENPVWKVW